MKGILKILVLVFTLSFSAVARIPNRNLDLYCSGLFPTDERAEELYKKLVDSIRDAHLQLFNEKPELETILRRSSRKPQSISAARASQSEPTDSKLERAALAYRELREGINAEIVQRRTGNKATAAQDQLLAEAFFTAVNDIGKYLFKARRIRGSDKIFMDIDGEWAASVLQANINPVAFYEQINAAAPVLRSLEAFTGFLQKCNEQCMLPHISTEMNAPVTHEEIKQAALLETSSEPLMRFSHPESCFQIQKKFSHLLSGYFLFHRRESLALDQKFELDVARTPRQIPELSGLGKRAKGLRPAHIEASMPMGRSTLKAIDE